MNLENLLEKLPQYAKDLKLNAKTLVLVNPYLSKKQIAIISVASSISTKDQILIEAAIEQFKPDLTEQELEAAKEKFDKKLKIINEAKSHNKEVS